MQNVSSLDEEDIMRIGKELFDSIKEPQKNLFSKKWWYGNLMQWTLSNPSFKTPLFRFVDVFPSLNKKKDIPFFLEEYLGGGIKKEFQVLPPVLSKSISFLSPMMLSAFISKQMKELARLFIIGEDLSSILPVLKQIRQKGSAFTLDLLGEATLSEAEANMYHKRYLQIIDQLHHQTKSWKENSSIDRNEKKEEIPIVNISIKVSSLDSQVLTVAWGDSKVRLKNKLRPLFQKALDTNTFINIDMEQYEYKTLTLEVFKELISEPEFKNYPHFGIVIQAYLKESLSDLKSFISFLQTHPVPITVRLVKGAYWDYELIHARQHNWPCPVYLNKWESDANFEACTRLILQSYPYLKLAVGSHNIRSITYALSLVKKKALPKKAVEIQTLYGMADPIITCLIKKGWRVRQYCPIGMPIPGMAYLVRRLLENTSNESFLRSWQNKNQNVEDMLKPPQVFKNQKI